MLNQVLASVQELDDEPAPTTLGADVSMVSIQSTSITSVTGMTRDMTNTLVQGGRASQELNKIENGDNGRTNVNANVDSKDDQKSKEAAQVNDNVGDLKNNNNKAAKKPRMFTQESENVDSEDESNDRT